MRLSALEQIPLFAGRTPRRAIEDTVRLARGLEDSGYHRFWIAEHHNTSAFVSSAPDLLMMHMLDATDRIRVGSGGIMAMHYGRCRSPSASPPWRPFSPGAWIWGWAVRPVATC